MVDLEQFYVYGMIECYDDHFNRSDVFSAKSVIWADSADSAIDKAIERWQKIFGKDASIDDIWC